jgi:hypothetical protein
VVARGEIEMMSSVGRPGSLRRAVASLVAALLFLATPVIVAAQTAAPTGELKRVVGRVEILAKGQTQWIPAVVGARLAEGDDIRTYAGASAELVLPDTSSVVVTENSRLLLTKIEFDPQNQSRFMLMHLVVGKVRATVAQAAVTLARIRQSNFAISTPTAVAAARGTIIWVFTDGQRSMMAVEPEFGFTEGSSQGVWRQ